MVTEASRHRTTPPEHIASREPTPTGEVLFHGTTLAHAVGILRDNDISTGIDWRGEGARVALTRSFNVAYGFGCAGDYDEYPVVFVLNWPSLVRDYIVRPHNDVDMNGEHWQNEHSEDGTEQEEAVYGHIAPLSRYLVSINADPRMLETALVDDDHADWCIEEKGVCRSRTTYRNTIKKLLASPLLNAWRPSAAPPKIISYREMIANSKLTESKTMGDMVEKASSLGIDLQLHEDNDKIELHWIERSSASPKGNGAVVMNMLCDYADDLEKIIILQTDWVARAELGVYYEQFGFEDLSDYIDEEDYEDHWPDWDFDDVMIRYPE